MIGGVVMSQSNMSPSLHAAALSGGNLFDGERIDPFLSFFNPATCFMKNPLNQP